MQKGRGRTSRIRRRKHLRSSESRGVNESYKSEFIELKKWLKNRKFEDRNLTPARFPGTGRGLMSRTPLRVRTSLLSLKPNTDFGALFLWFKSSESKEGQMIISLPESCLLTTETVIRSYLGVYITKWKPRPSPLLALCTFLVSERHAGDRSLWKPYLQILPKTYTCPVCLEPEVVNLLPKALKAKTEEQRAHVQKLFTSSRDFFSSLQPLFVEPIDSIFSYSALLWAWCTVNTRAVYLRPRKQECLSAEPDTCALAPYLDLLNHSPHVQVNAAFNEKTRCYEIRTASGCRKHEEVFICYGPHDNQRLLLEYGFVSPCNPHACVYVSRDTLVKYLPSTDKQMNKKISILKDHGFIENLTFGWDGPSWRLLTALKLLCLEAEKFTGLLQPGVSSGKEPSSCCCPAWLEDFLKSTCWKKVLLGEVISDANEKTSLDVAQKICHHLLEESSAMLQRVSHMKDEKVSLVSQLALVETLWLEELKVLQASAETLASMHTTYLASPERLGSPPVVGVT
ncbi:SET domain-containing protein 4 isoform X1 [Marmota marmota marmota]|uniref:SET domain-containing protein 4 isoform X1 n=2 Tax=Marmota marmota marmota TaxID=9994 RepID=UPI002093C383|nr:SET domain-containing protein 4 isoform X1 [Marmota marmota marmota]XP_048659591.1 SET domain-containing protein 4 isoform X1 [Marmota marmota marmota]XP_048659595.1 SET domain-containing protein 4 isoform X1 [Marmota marmota marmota]XP_048659596.1 SET domain-containing protein 4 isoform X1 [Marmota marmota marmota]XP_048659597.1 SET domain-containing protein 4 isoform X1 [Marmota marmota marmota]XP_048659598.1 SET domain-containing protein 4 isoform X1 [Marmota marmota marmota]XP_04865959